MGFQSPMPLHTSSEYFKQLVIEISSGGSSNTLAISKKIHLISQLR